MDRQNRSIIDNLLKNLPNDAVVVHSWLEKIGQGAFKRAVEKELK